MSPAERKLTRQEIDATIDEWRPSLIDWATRTAAVSELWLFGSFAKGTAQTNSDADLAVALIPSAHGHDWAFGDYVALADRQWKPQLQQIVARPISFGVITSGDKMDQEVRSTGTLLWKRSVDG